LGRITLEAPEVVEKELVEMLEIRQRKAAEKAAKKQKKHGSRGFVTNSVRS